MRILVTGARGKVGSATVAALADAGHDVSATDMSRPRFEADAGGVPYRQGDLTDAGDAFALVRGHDAVVHTAAIPDPMHNPPHVVFANNLTATFNVIEAAVRFGVPRVVNLSSETVPGFFFPERPFLPDYVPVDEQHPIRPQDPYATAKHFGEQLMDGGHPPLRPDRDLDPAVMGAVGGEHRGQPRPVAARAGRVRGVLGLHRRLRPGGRDPARRRGDDARARGRLHRLARHRLARDARDAERSASTATRRPRSGHRTEERPNGISIAKARALIGYDPQRSWRDYLEDDGRLRPAVRERLERGATGVQRGRRMTGATGPPGGA